MSNEMRKGTDIAFADKTRTIYPVSLRQLRKLRTAIESVDFENIGAYPDDETINAMVKAAAIILASVDPEVAEDLEKVEDIVDVSNFTDMLAAGMGADPNE